MRKIQKKFGKFTIEMRDCKEIEGHDDSYPYIGYLYVNGKQFCKCYNDGWGGNTMLTTTEYGDSIFQEVKAEVEKEKDVFNGLEIPYTIDFVADELAVEYAEEEEIHRLQDKYLLFKKGTLNIIQLPFKYKGGKATIPIKELMLTEKSQKTLYDSITKYESIGYELLNRNLQKDLKKLREKFGK